MATTEVTSPDSLSAAKAWLDESSDQVQRNIIGERVLGLPKEPGPSRDTPFRELLQNPMQR